MENKHLTDLAEQRKKGIHTADVVKKPFVRIDTQFLNEESREATVHEIVESLDRYLINSQSAIKQIDVFATCDCKTSDRLERVNFIRPREYTECNLIYGINIFPFDLSKTKDIIEVRETLTTPLNEMMLKIDPELTRFCSVVPVPEDRNVIVYIKSEKKSETLFEELEYYLVPTVRVLRSDIQNLVEEIVHAYGILENVFHYASAEMTC